MPTNKENERLADEYIRYLAISSTKQGTDSFRWGLRRFIVWLEKRPVFSIVIADVIAYTEYLTEQGLKSGTRNQYLCAVKSFWRYHEDLDRTPFPSRLFPKVPIRDKVSFPPLREEEFAAVMSAIPTFVPTGVRERCAFSLLYATGMRINELLSLNVTDLNLAARRGEVRTEKRLNHTRPIYWDEFAHAELLAWLDARRQILVDARVSQEALFVNLSDNNLGIRLDDANLQRSFRNVRDRIGLPRNLVVHSFRHGFATLAHQRRVDMLHISKMLGHAKVATTQVYLHTQENEIEESYCAAFGGGKMKTTYEDGTNKGVDKRAHAQAQPDAHRQARAGR